MKTRERLVVPYVDLARQHAPLERELLEAVRRVLAHGQFILGPEVQEFERAFASYVGARYAIGVANGTDALILALRALGIGPGDEVITVPNSFLATASAIATTGARPVFVDVRDDLNLDPELLDRAITPRTRAIIPVHLTGRPADMDAILRKADRHGIPVIEDAAQAMGARYRGRVVGSLGAAGCFSLHPVKTLNAIGDGGVIATNRDDIFEYVAKARNHGLRDRNHSDFWGLNSRLDTLQAALLQVKWKYLDDWIRQRRAHAGYLRERLLGLVEVPSEKPHEYAVYHLFVVQHDRRDELQRHLLERGVESKVHYPTPIHLQSAARGLGYKRGDFPVAEQQASRIISLPVYAELTEEQLAAIVEGVSSFVGS